MAENNYPVVEVYYFTSAECSICPVLKPKVKALLTERFVDINFRSIDIKEEAVLAAQFSVFTIPVLLILVDGREQYRFVRNFSVNELEMKLSRLMELIS